MSRCVCVCVERGARVAHHAHLYPCCSPQLFAASSSVQQALHSYRSLLLQPGRKLVLSLTLSETLVLLIL